MILELATNLREVLQCLEKAPTYIGLIGAFHKEKALI